MAAPEQHTPIPQGPVEGDTMIGADEAPERRPGVPLNRRPGPTGDGRRAALPSQPVPRGRLRRKGLARMTPVFGTATPPRGLSGVVRRLAYRVPEHRTRHWMMLLGADRIDAVEGRLGELLARPLRRRGHDRTAHAVESNPMRIVGGLALVSAGAILGLRRIRS